MSNRIGRTFSKLKKEKRKALIGYITAGFPKKASFQVLVPLLEKAGLDLLEVGVPFSDPVADGPTIQHSSQIALRNGVTLDWIIESVRVIRKKGVQLPIILMSYCNPIHTKGFESFFREAAAAGVDGLIIPDLIPEEGKRYSQAAAAHGINLIYLVAPTTPKARIKMIAGKTQGFLYAVSMTGVTGVKKAVSSEVKRFLSIIRSVTAKPIAVGFGLSTPQQVSEVAAYADGVIVGSALIRAIEKSEGSSFSSAVSFVRSLAEALASRKES